MQVRNWKVLGVILAVTFLLVGFCTISGLTDETEATKYTLTITDGWGLLDHLSQVLVHEVVEGSGSESPVAVNNSPSNPVQFQLKPGTYTFTLVAVIPGWKTLSWTSDPINLTKDITWTLPTPSEG